MAAKQLGSAERRLGALAAVAFLLAIYSFVAVFCIAGQLPVPVSAPGHNAPEVLHLQVDGTAGAAAGQGIPDRPVSELTAHHHILKLAGLGTSSPKTSQLAVATSSWAGLDLVPESALFPEGWPQADLAARRWYRTVVLLI